MIWPCMTITGISDTIRLFKIKHYYSVYEGGIGIVKIRFWRTRWYNFIRKSRIRSFRLYLEQNKPIGVCIEHEITGEKA